jgi:hypothetical protein
MGGAVYTPFTGSGQNKNFVKREDEIIEHSCYLILLLLRMNGIVELKTLYEHIDNTIGGATANHGGHINIFKIDDIHGGVSTRSL